MIPSFFALFSKAGIACAADTDHTVYRLSKDLPVALAVNPLSPIPWEEIIEQFKKNLDSQTRESLADYAFEFDAFLSDYMVEDSGQGLSPLKERIMFFGYGSEDIFPSAYNVSAVIKATGVLGLEDGSVHSVTHRDLAFYHSLGNFESVMTLLTGTTGESRRMIFDRYVEAWEKYAGRVSSRFKGTEYEQYVEKHLVGYDYKSYIASRIDNPIHRTLLRLTIGVDSFSVEDMVTAVETIVNANSKLNHLRSNASGKPGNAQEIAVVTIPEGLSWIKHSLYHRRNEI